MGAGADRNEPCACGSGKKYKKCHFLREQETPLKISEVLAKESAAKIQLCLHPSRAQCNGAIVRAHTVQRALLDKIADNGHVLGLKRGLANLKKNQGRFLPEKIGIRNASTFTGFCAFHDKTTFAPVEDTAIEASRLHAFLLSYRAISYELYAKQYQQTMTETLLKQMDKGRSETEQAFHQHFVGNYGNAVDIGLRDLRHHKQRYDDVLSSGDNSRVQAVFVVLDRPPPFMVNGAIFPECSFSGEQLQDLADADAVLDELGFSLLVSGGKGIVVLSWLTSAESSPASKLVDSLLALGDAAIPDALTRFVFEFFENVYLDPRWWDALTDTHRDAVVHRIGAGVSAFNDRLPNCLVDDGLRMTPFVVEEIVDLRATK